MLPKTGVPSTSEGDKGKRPVLLVLHPRLSKALWVVLLRLSVHVVELVRNRRGHDQNVVLWDLHSLVLYRLLDMAHEQDQWRIHAQRLLHAVVQLFHRHQSIEIQFSIGAVLLTRRLLLFNQLLQKSVLLVVDQKRSPCGRNGGRVLPSKQQRDQHPRDLFVGQARAVLVLRGHQRVDEVVRHLFSGRHALPTCVQHATEQFDHGQTRPVAPAVRLDGQVREEDADGLHALIQIVVQPRDFGVELLSDLFTHQTAAGGEDDEF
mmetsp:Transcript_17716/g.30676  ORF Transcript_17716/g.30676 Transcript_17716/m.30676 type:complete len:263 (-) Transcript_17716:518-1306(-)